MAFVVPEIKFHFRRKVTVEKNEKIKFQKSLCKGKISCYNLIYIKKDINNLRKVIKQ